MPRILSGSTPTVTLVLGGGAHLGAVQAGQLLALAEADIQVSGMYGCSVGALNGAWISSGLTRERAQELIDIWTQAEVENLFDRGLRRMYAIIRGEPSLSRSDRVRELVDRACASDDLADFTIPLEVVTCNLTRGRAEYHRTGDARTYITASCSMPGMLPPVDIDGERHVDGGVLDVLPWRRALEHSSGAILVLDCRSGQQWTGGDGTSALGVVLDSFALARHHRAYDGVDNTRVSIVPGATIERSSTERDVGALIDESYERCHAWIREGGLDSALRRGRRWRW